jgi:cobalt-zinc-cadmium efflux system outer membrane protein
MTFRDSGFGLRASVVILVIGLANASFAQDTQMPAQQPTPTTAQDGTIEQLVATALQRSPEIRAARTAAEAAAAEVTQMSLRPNPTLTATQMQMSGAQHQSLFTVEWPLDLFRRPTRVDAARQNAEATEYSIRDRERMLAFAVRQQAGKLLAARRTVEVMNEALTTARRTRELLDAQVTEGGIPKIDANLAAVGANRIEAEAVLAQSDVDSATIELRALIGLEPNAPLVLRDTLESVVQGGGQQEAASGQQEAQMPGMDMSKVTVAMRSDVREANARLAAATARVDSARQQGRLDMSLVGNYGQEHYGFQQRGFTTSGALVPVQGDFRSVTFGATLVLPVRNRNQGGLAAAEAERNGAEQALAARQLVAQAEIDAATLRAREARRAVDLYATNVRELARQNVEVELEAFDLGRTPLTDLLAEQRRYLDVEAGYTSVLARAYDAQVTLRTARDETR